MTSRTIEAAERAAVAAILEEDRANRLEFSSRLYNTCMSSIDSIETLLSSRRNEILSLAAKHGATNVRVFGSVARGEADEASDLDLLVDMEPERSLLDRAGLWLDLNQALGIRVDVVSAHGIKPRFRERILAEARPL